MFVWAARAETAAAAVGKPGRGLQPAKQCFLVAVTTCVFVNMCSMVAVAGTLNNVHVQD